jgi:hypothetical protein
VLRFCYLLGAGGAGGGARRRGGAQPVFIMANIAKSNTTITYNKPVAFVFIAAVILFYNNRAGAMF